MALNVRVGRHQHQLMLNDLADQHSVECVAVDVRQINQAPNRRFIHGERFQFMRHATVAQKHVKCLSVCVHIELAQAILMIISQDEITLKKQTLSPSSMAASAAFERLRGSLTNQMNVQVSSRWRINALLSLSCSRSCLFWL